MDHTLSLIQLAHQGDKEARDTLIKENMGLVYAVARRFLGRGIDRRICFRSGVLVLSKRWTSLIPLLRFVFLPMQFP